MPRFRVPIRLLLEVQTANLPEAWAEIGDYFYVGRRFLDENGVDLPMRVASLEIESELPGS